MAVVDIQQRSKHSYSEGQKFGGFGTFEIAEFDISYAVDPEQDGNNRIVDIKKAPTDTDGLVHFIGNAKLVYPGHSTPACLLVDVPNRGRPTAFSFNRAAPAELQRTSTPTGDGFLYRHGFAVLSIGWQFDVEGMSLDVPHALIDGEPIRGDAICQMQPSRDTTSLLVGQGGVFTYPPTGKGRLFQRPNTQAAFEEVDSTTWRFGRERDGTFDPTPTHISKDGGFTKGIVYTLVYETEGAPVVGLGLLALRDAATYFKHDFEWPNEQPPLAIGYGASQTGRILRHFVYEGLNSDEQDRQVFDAVMPHIAGGQRGDFNHRFAQPGSLGIPAAGQRFPFSTTSSTDTLTGDKAGLLDRCEHAPKVVSTNTSWEYWRGDAALIHVSTDGSQDLPLREDDRVYMFAGTHHINGVLPLTSQLMLTNEQFPYPLNTVSYTPLLRAVLRNTLMWLKEGIEPPESQYPRLGDGSLVSRHEVLKKFTISPHFADLPDANGLPGLFSLDLGDAIEDGVCVHPAQLIKPYPRLVADVAENLNEVAGIRLPEISVPIGIHSGWNPRHAIHGAPDQTATFAGFSVFEDAATVPESRANCLEAVEHATDELIATRYVLPEDRALVIENAMTRFDIAQQVLTAKQPE